MAEPTSVELWNGLDPHGPSTVVWPRRVEGSRVALLLGAFDPITNAHVSIADAVRDLWSLPVALCMTKVLLARSDDELLGPEQRVTLIDAVAARCGFGFALSNRGTYLDVGRALRASSIDATFVVGSDKLAQLADPSFYDDGPSGVGATFRELRFIVIPRRDAPIERDDVIVADPQDVFADGATASLSATEVRATVRRGMNVEHLVPTEVAVALGGYTSAR